MKFNFTVFLIFMLALTYDVSSHAVQCKFILHKYFNHRAQIQKNVGAKFYHISLNQNGSKEILRTLLQIYRGISSYLSLIQNATSIKLRV